MSAAGVYWPHQGDLCRDAYLLTKKTILGWHSFTPLDDDCLWWYCAPCHTLLPRWAVVEAYWPVMAGAVCPGFLTAIPEHAGPDGDPLGDTGRLF